MCVRACVCLGIPWLKHSRHAPAVPPAAVWGATQPETHNTMLPRTLRRVARVVVALLLLLHGSAATSATSIGPAKLATPPVASPFPRA